MIAAGGCGAPSDAVKLLKKTQVSGLSIASMFHFTEFTPLDVKKALKKNKFNIRM